MTEDATDSEETLTESAKARDGSAEAEEDGEKVNESDHDETETADDASDAVASMYDQGPTPDQLVQEEASDDAKATADSDDGEDSGGLGGGPLLGEDDDMPEPEAGTFYVKSAEDTAVTLHEVETTQIYTLIENPGFETHDIVEASLMAQPPMEVSYTIHELEAHYSIPIEESPEPPTRQVQEAGEKMSPMEALALEREGKGEIHVLSVEPEDVDRTVEELHDDEMTYKNAARYEAVERVELRSDEEIGVVSIRYLP